MVNFHTFCINVVWMLVLWRLKKNVAPYFLCCGMISVIVAKGVIARKLGAWRPFNFSGFTSRTDSLYPQPVLADSQQSGPGIMTSCYIALFSHLWTKQWNADIITSPESWLLARKQNIPNSYHEYDMISHCNPTRQHQDFGIPKSPQELSFMIGWIWI